MEAKTINPDETLKASYDERYDYKRHFIITDISRKFLDKHGFNDTQVEDFKDRVRASKPVFHAKTGNPNFSKGYRSTPVYDINKYKPKEN